MGRTVRKKARAATAAGDRVPAKLGYRMPAEWEAHAATWLAWPRAEAWGDSYSGVPEVWVEIVRALSPSEAVHILAASAAERVRAERMLREGGVSLQDTWFHEVPIDDNWLRDNGPTFVTGAGGSAVVAWRFNAWGCKYGPWRNDAAVPLRLAEMLDLPMFEPGLILEGGSIDVNGEGVVLATEQCLLNSSRNPGKGRREMEQVLCDYLGVCKVLWLGGGIAGDDTDGHVDQVARFVGPRTVVAVVEEDPSDENYEPLQDNLRRLRRARDRDGRTLDVVELPMPGPVFDGSQRLPASYANFYIGNGCVLVPAFRQSRDAAAVAVLEGVFPGRRVVGIDAVPLVAGRGAIHCVTQQQPGVRDSGARSGYGRQALECE